VKCVEVESDHVVGEVPMYNAACVQQAMDEILKGDGPCVRVDEFI
jgi:hypothetical protein